MAKKITSAVDVFIALGGTAKVVKLLGVCPAAISTMRTNGLIPAHHFPKVQGALLRIGKTAEISVFNFNAFKREPKGSPSRRR